MILDSILNKDAKILNNDGFGPPHPNNFTSRFEYSGPKTTPKHKTDCLIGSIVGLSCGRTWKVHVPIERLKATKF